MKFNLAFALLLGLMPLSASGDTPGRIGVATMADDGTIRLQLIARSDDGAIADGILVYRAGDTQYNEVLKHVGGIKPGEEKPVPAWPPQPNPKYGSSP
jgi:hypothetical protein